MQVPEEVPNPLELALQEVINQLMWMDAGRLREEE